MLFWYKQWLYLLGTESVIFNFILTMNSNNVLFNFTYKISYPNCLIVQLLVRDQDECLVLHKLQPEDLTESFCATMTSAATQLVTAMRCSGSGVTVQQVKYYCKEMLQL